MSSQLYYHRLLPLLDPTQIEEARSTLDEYTEYVSKLENCAYSLTKANKALCTAIDDIESDIEEGE